MSNSPVTTLFLISGLVFIMLAVIGNAKLGFAEINPGFFGRFLALIFGMVSLIIAVLLVVFPVEMLDVIKNSLAEQIQQNMSSLNLFKSLS